MGRIEQNMNGIEQGLAGQGRVGQDQAAWLCFAGQVWAWMPGLGRSHQN